MKFKRMERYEPVTMTPRRQSAFARKQANERARYPLFSDEISAQQIDLTAEHKRRQVCLDRFEAEMRAFHARVWKTARSLYFGQSAEIRAQIRSAWDVRTGPQTSTYFSYIVDTLSGEQARRLARVEAEQRPLIEAAKARRQACITLPLFI